MTKSRSQGHVQKELGKYQQILLAVAPRVNSGSRGAELPGQEPSQGGVRVQPTRETTSDPACSIAIPLYETMKQK